MIEAAPALPAATRLDEATRALFELVKHQPGYG